MDTLHSYLNSNMKFGTRYCRQRAGVARWMTTGIGGKIAPVGTVQKEDLTTPIRVVRRTRSLALKLGTEKTFAVFRKPVFCPVWVEEKLELFYTPQSEGLRTCETLLTEVSVESEHKGMSLDLLLVPVDPFFLCAKCGFLVSSPQECSYCENLTCASCSSSGPLCPQGCSSPSFHRPSKYALLTYNRIQIKCKNYLSGCPHTGNVDEMNTHNEHCSSKENSPDCEQLESHNTKNNCSYTANAHRVRRTHSYCNRAYRKWKT